MKGLHISYSKLLLLLLGARAGQGAVDKRTPAKMKAGPRGEVTQSFNGVGDAARAGRPQGGRNDAGAWGGHRESR